MKMGKRSAASDIDALGVLAEPNRRALFDLVAASDEGVGRDEAAAALGLKRATAAHHLDRLVDAGLLVTDSRRLTGRQGPGAGRPAKIYRRSSKELSVELPPRDYELLARLLAEAIEEATTSGEPIDDALASVARRLGARLGGEIDGGALLVALEAIGYEPNEEADGSIILRNCPFHHLARSHTSMVCNMNLSLLDSVVTSSGAQCLARLEPREGRCCVVLAPND